MLRYKSLWLQACNIISLSVRYNSMFVCYTDGAKELSQTLEEIFQIYIEITEYALWVCVHLKLGGLTPVSGL